MSTHRTVADLFRPCEKCRGLFYDLLMITCGSFVIGICAQFKILLPFSPVPVTAQTFAVLMTGALLGPVRGSLAVAAYLAQGLAGLPVFAAVPSSGPAVLFGPTGGYLAGFIPAAFVTGYLAQKGWDRSVFTTFLAMILGNITIYAFGLGWLCLFLGLSNKVLTMGLYPFIAGDCVKAVLAAALLPSGWKLLGKFGPGKNKQI